MPAGRRCPGPRCPVILTAGQRYCPTHARDYETRRGTKQQRGYDGAYDAARRRAAELVATGTAHCWRCGGRLDPAAPFDLGHDDRDRSIIRGPEHPHCNRSAAGRSAHDNLG